MLLTLLKLASLVLWQEGGGQVGPIRAQNMVPPGRFPLESGGRTRLPPVCFFSHHIWLLRADFQQMFP